MNPPNTSPLHPDVAQAALPSAGPYVGPRAFMPGEKLYGREREARTLYDLLAAERIVLCHSPSGAGKTSLIQALLIPWLKEPWRKDPRFRDRKPEDVDAEDPRLKTLKGFAVYGPVRASDPVAAQVASQVKGANRYVLSVLMRLEEAQADGADRIAPEALAALTLDAYLARRAGRDDPGSEEDDPGSEDKAPDISTSAVRGEVVVFDQFEEILTVDPHDVEGKTAFFRQVGEALRAPRRRALFAMREEHVAALDPYVPWVPTRLAVRYPLELLDDEAARKAIAFPAEAAGVPFTEEALTQLVENLRRVPEPGTSESVLGRYVEPVQLQVVCTRLWQKVARLPQRPRQIGAELVGGVEDVDTALAEYYAETVRRVSEETGVAERPIRVYFGEALISGGVRAQVARGSEREFALTEGVVTALVNAYLVRREDRRDSLWYELAHDRLVRPVEQDNARWFSDRESALQRRAREWEKGGRPSYALLRGRELDEARRWAGLHADETEPGVRDFLDKSEVAKKVRRLTGGMIALAALLLLTSSALLWLRNGTLRQTASDLEQELVYETATAERARAEVEAAEATVQVAQADSALEASETGLEIAPVRDDIRIVYYRRPSDGPSSNPRCGIWASLWTYVLLGLEDPGATTNAVAYGPGVDAASSRLVALALVRAGVRLKQVCPARRDTTPLVIQAFADVGLNGVVPITVDQITGLDEAAMDLNCGTVPTSRVYLHYRRRSGRWVTEDGRRMEALRLTLQRAGFDTPDIEGIEGTSALASGTFGEEDRALAERVLTITQRELGLLGLRVVRSRGNVRRSQVEVWVVL